MPFQFESIANIVEASHPRHAIGATTSVPVEIGPDRVNKQEPARFWGLRFQLFGLEGGKLSPGCGLVESGVQKEVSSWFGSVVRKGIDPDDNHPMVYWRIGVWRTVLLHRIQHKRNVSHLVVSLH